jgi:DNA repair protein SbcD/Mre11
MRFIHTADWHLGRLFHGLHLTDDQAHFLDQLVSLMRDTKPDALIVAGDIYDRAVPPPEAVRVLDEFLREVALDLDVPIVMIAGNHDSADRLAFGSELLRHRGVHLFGPPSDPCGRVSFGDDHGEVDVYCLPYADPPRVRECLRDDTLLTHDDAMRASVERIRAARPEGRRSILVGHAFVGGGEGSDSERPLAIGGAELVSVDSLEGFDYVALGHLHRAQQMGGGRVRYSGSPLKYSFSEADHRKCVHVVEMDAAGRCVVEDVPLTARRDVRRVSGRFEDLLSDPARFGPREDYLMIELEDEGTVIDAVGRLREHYPHLLHIAPKDRQQAVGSAVPRGDHRRTSDDEVFSRFFLDVTGVEITAPQRQRFVDAVDRMAAEEREVNA